MNKNYYPILDPDYSYHTHISHDKLYHFFKNLSKPSQIHFMTSIFIEFEIPAYSFEKNPDFYQHISPKLKEKLNVYVNYNNSNIFCHHNIFYLVLFNENEHQLNKSLCNFHHFLNEHSFQYHEKECHFFIKCGIYHSHIFIDPFQFYKHAYTQYVNLHKNNDSFLSIHYL